eukprot:CAMPEP_0197935684 /NCGR_PEP_ID=MMETSP1439-20131203/113734_1 /TAXON_ID=66791 /ORGANISM="Gonyaulax spinifera, Strain CCMP409" /LENGTH=62 /DNA_ID=CAMNT_0043558635 /DNA_START=66 /DNA_END=252 /DNA_ORIENTATION=+
MGAAEEARARKRERNRQRLRLSDGIGVDKTAHAQSACDVHVLSASPSDGATKGRLRSPRPAE